MTKPRAWNSAKGIVLFLLLTTVASPAFASWADVNTDEGMGYYNYIEKDAAATHVHYKTDWTSWSSSSVWVDVNGSGSNYGGGYVHDGGGGGDGAKHLSTGSLVPGNHGGNWVAGNNIDMYYKMDGDPDEGNSVNAWLIVDVAKTDIAAGNIMDNEKMLVLKFMLDVGSEAGRQLTRLWVHNNGTLQEGDDCSTDSVYLYYEDGTSLSFDGTENSVALNESSGSGTDETWGSNSLALNIPNTGGNKLCCYIVIRGVFQSGIGKTATFQIIADGISMNTYGTSNNADNLCKLDATTNANALTVRDEDTAPPVIASSSAPAPRYTDSFVVNLSVTDTQNGVSPGRSRAYFSWSANPGPANFFYDTFAYNPSGNNFDFICPYNVASNLFSSNIGKTLYWIVYMADSDADRAGSDDSSFISTSGNATVRPLERDLVINELGRAGTSTTSSSGDFIELYNRSGYTIYTDNLACSTTRAAFLPKPSGSIANGAYWLMEDVEGVAAATSDSIVAGLTLESNDTVIIQFGAVTVDSAQVYTGLSSENSASLSAVNQIALERISQSAYGFSPASWQSAAKLFIGSCRGGSNNTLYAGTPGAANTDSSAPIFISELMNGSAANRDGNYIELYNGGADSYVLNNWSITIGGSLEITGLNASDVIAADSFLLIEDNTAATTVSEDLLDPSNAEYVSGGNFKTFVLYRGAADTTPLVDRAGAADGWKAATTDVALEKDVRRLRLDSTAAYIWGNSTGGLGGVTGTPRDSNVFKDNAGPVITVNRDSHTIKVRGDSYGFLFNVDFADALSNIDSIWIQRVPPADTYAIATNVLANSYTANWRISDAFLSSLTNEAVSPCIVMARDTWGNVSTSSTIYIQREQLLINGDTSDWQDDEIIDMRKGNELRVAWDDTTLFVSYGGPDGSVYEVGGAGADFFFYIQTAGATEGTNTSYNWGSAGTHTLPFQANYCIVLEGDNTPTEENDVSTRLLQYTGGAWTVPTNQDSAAWLGRHTTNNRTNEYRIAWSYLGGLPESIALIFFHQYEAASNIYNALPPANPAGGGTNLTLTDYYLIPILKDTVSPQTAQRVSTLSARRRVDGETDDWNWQNMASSDDTSLIKDSEFIWRAKIDDERTDFADVDDKNFDLRALRITGDTNNLYVLTVVQNLVDANLLMQAIAIDTDLITGSGQQEIGGVARTRTVDTAKWEMCYLANSSRFGWWDTGFSNNLQTDGSAYVSAIEDVIEVAIPWTRLYKSVTYGDSIPRRLRFTIMTGRKNATQPLDFAQEGSWNAVTTSRALDAVDITPRKPAGFASEVVDPDTEIGYYFEVDFDTTGYVIANKLDPISYPALCTTARAFNVTLEASDFNGNPMGNNTTLGAVTFGHNGTGNLTIVSDSIGWSSGQRRFSLMYTAHETITITCTESLHGKTGRFTLQCAADTSGPNAWYLNDSVASASDSFTGAVGNDANNGLTPMTPKLTLSAVFPYLTPGDTVFLAAGTFDRNSELTIDDTGVRIQGVDSLTTVIRFTAAEAVKINTVDSVIIQDLQIQKPTRGIWISDADSCIIRRVRIDTATVYLLFLDNGSDSNLIENCHFRKSDQHGVLLNSASDRNTVLGNFIEQATFHGLLLSSKADTNYLINNISQDNAQHGISIDDGDFCVLSGNRARRNGQIGIILANNTFRCTMNGDTTDYNSQLGLQLSGGGFHTIQNTYVHDNGQAGVDFVASSTDNTVLGIRSDSNAYDGLRITSGNNNAIRHSRFKYNRESGFRIFAGNTGCVFAGNTSESNTQYATWVSDATLVFRKNNITKDTGINALNADVAGINASRNWWGTKDSAAVRALITSFNATTYTPYRLGEVDSRAGADTVAPNPAVGLAISNITLNGLTVNWTAVTTDEESTSAAFALYEYRVYQAKATDTTYWVLRGSTSSTSFTDSNLTTGDLYYYRVCAYDTNTPTNEAFFGDSVSGRPSVVDTYFPNKWYVNDASTVGDSFTSAVGNNANNGLSISTPKLTIEAVFPFLTRGDTVYIDKGVFTPSDTIEIETHSIWVIGVDSLSTIINFADSTAPSFNSFKCSDANNVTLQDFCVRDAYHGVHVFRSDTVVLKRIRSMWNKEIGIILETSADSVHVENCWSHNNLTYGYYLGDANRGYLTANRAETNTNHGFMLTAASETNTLTNNVSHRNVADGYHITASGTDSNLLYQNTATNNSGASFALTTGARFNWLRENTTSASAAQGFYVATDSNIVDSNLITSEGSDGIALVNAGYTVVRKNTIVSAPSNGIYLDGSSWNRLDSNVIQRAAGVGLYVNNNSDRNTVSGNVIRLNTGVGLGLLGGSDSNFVCGNRVETNTGDGYKVEASDSNTLYDNVCLFDTGAGFSLTSTTKWTTLRSCTSILSIAQGFYVSANLNTLIANRTDTSRNLGFWLNNGDSNVLEGNRAVSSANEGFKVENSSDSNLLVDCASESNGGAGYAIVASSSFNTLRRSSSTRDKAQGFYAQVNYVFLFECRADTSTTNGINLTFTGFSEVNGCTVTYAGQPGIILYGASNNRVHANHSVNNSNDGIMLDNQSQYCTISHNYVARNSDVGILLYDNADGNWVEGNTAELNVNDGLLLQGGGNGGSDNNKLRRNVIRLNKVSGIKLLTAANNLFEANESDSNGDYQLFIDGASTGNVIRKNNFHPRPGANDTTIIYIDVANQSFARNYWGITDSNQIRGRIAGGAKGTAIWYPWRLSAVDTAQAYDTVAPQSPDTVSAQGWGTETMLITWSGTSFDEESDSNAVSASGFRIYRSRTLDTSVWFLVGETKPGTYRHFVDTIGLATNTLYYYKVTAYDDISPYYNESFFGDTTATDSTNAFARVVIGEIGVGYTADEDSDFVELYVADDNNEGRGANLKDWKIYNTSATANRTLRKQIGDLAVRTGDFVTLFFNSVDGAPDSTATSATDSHAWIFTSASNSILTTGQGLLEVEAAGTGVVRDAVVYSDQVTLDGVRIAPRLQILVDSGLWSPDNTAGNTVSNTGLATRGQSIRRANSMGDSNVKEDWGRDTQSPGSFRLATLEAVTESTTPYVGLPFVIRLGARDHRGDSVTGARAKPGLSITAGTIAPTTIRFDTAHAARLDASETSIPVTITGTYDTQTITFTEGGVSCTVAVVVRAPLDSFVLTAPNAPHKVIRNDSFGLRVRASNIFGGTVTFFTGAVTLSVPNGTIIPSSLTFTPADLGDTTILAQVSGIGQCSITASSSNKTGTTVVIPVHDTRLVISEILFNDEDRAGSPANTDRDEFIEIYNRGTSAKNLANHTLRIRPLAAASDQTFTFPSLSVPAGKFVVVHFNKWGTNDLNFNDTDGAAHLFSQNTTPAMADSEDVMPHSAASVPNSVTLHDSTTQDSRTVIDFVGMDAGATSNTALHDTDANLAGLWVKYATLNYPTTAANNIGRSFYRMNEVSDSDGTSSAEWSTIASDGSTDSYRYTDGYSNKNNVWPSGSIVISCSTTSSPLRGDTVAAGDTIYIWLSATTDGDAAAANTTNVFVYSDTDPTGIVVTLKETGNNTKLFYGEAGAATSPLESNDGMRRVLVQPGDSVTIQWVGSLTVKRSTAVTGSVHHFRVTPSATTINQGDALTLTVTAQDQGNWTVTSFTGTCTITLTDSRTYPDTFKFIPSGNGETSVSVLFGSAAGTITCTVTTVGGITGTTVVTVIADTDVLINEVMANVGSIDWKGNGGTTDADEWIELYNKGTTPFSIEGYKLRPQGSAASITLKDTIPPKGWVTIFRGTSGTGDAYHYDSTGYPVDTDLNLTGNFSFSLVDGGGTVELLDPLNTVAAAVTYEGLSDDSSYGRGPDGKNAWYILKRPTPGLNGTPSPDNLLSPNTRFRFDAPDTVTLNSAFTLRVALTTYNGDTITTFLDTATIVSESSGTLTPTSLAFTNGICTTSVTYTAGSNNETSILTVYTYGAISGRDSVGLRAVTVSRETTQVNVEQAVANGIDTSMVQVIAMTATGAPLAGMTVTITSSKGALDTIVPSSATTNAAGYCSFTVVSRDTGPSKITAVVDGLTVYDSPVIYWLDPAESGVQTSFGTKTTILTLDDDSHFILFPRWAPNGKALAWLAKTAAVDTWCVYTAFDDGAHGDGAANDGTFTTYRVTDASHNVFQGSKVAFADILKADGTRCAAGEAGDGVPDIIYSAYNGLNRKDLFAVRAEGHDSLTAKAALVRLTATEGNWTMPSMVSDDTIYAIFNGSIYRLHGKGAGAYSIGGGTDKILEAGTASDFLISGKNFTAVDIALYDSNVMAVTMILNKTGDSNRNKRSEILLINGVETAGYRQWTSITGSCKLVTRPDSGVAWNLSWDTGGRSLSWAREVNGNFNWLSLWNRPSAPEAVYLTSDFDVEAVYVTETWYTPNRPVSLINNKGGMNDQSACFSMGSTARVAYASYDTRLGQVKLNIVDIDGVSVVDQDGGLLFQDGRLTAVVDEGDNLSGSVEIKIQRPTSAPSNATPESIALTGNAREFFPNGKTFDDSITVILYYDAADLTAAGVTNGTAEEYTLRVYWYNPTLAIWQDYNAIVDPTDRNGALGSLTFQTNHFSIYGVGFAPEHPNRPDLIAPAQSSTVSTRSPVFSFRHNDPRNRAQIGFQIEISADSGFATPILSETRSTADTTVTLNALLPAGESTLYWRVRTSAVASAYGAWSVGDSSFLTSIRVPSAPALVAPAAGSDTRSSRPVFTWLHSDPDADPQSKARLQVSSDSAFTSPVVDNTLESSAQSVQIDETLSDGTYWWRVQTSDLNGFGNWSSIRSLTVNTLPLAPTVVSAPAAITHPTPAFAWTHNDPDGRPQASFRLLLSQDSTFASSLLDLVVDTSAAASTLTGDRALTVRGTKTIFYRLSTAASGRSFGPIASGSFTAILNPPAAPSLISPADNSGTTALSLTFAWTHSDGEGDTQTGYAFRIGRDTMFASPLYQEEQGGAVTSRTLTLSLSGGVYYWQAATRDAVDRGPWSAIRSFAWSGETGPMPPGLAAPAEAASVRTPQPTFQWAHRDRNNAPQSAALLEISRNASFSPLWRSRAVVGSAQSATLDASDSLYQSGETTVYWRVRTASFGTDYGAPSAESSFTLRTSLPSAPTLLAPADGYSTRQREAEFSWRPVSVHDSLPQTAFDFQIARDPGLISSATYSGLEDPSIIVSLTAGNSFWRVRTATAMGWGDWSETRTIAVDTHPFAPTPLEPAAGATISTPRPLFRWVHNDPASAPQKTALIEIASDSAFSSLVRSAAVETSSASWRPRESESLPLAGNFTLYWRVRTSNAGIDYSAVSGDTAFSVTLNRPTAPTAATPFDTTRDIRPLFTWTHHDPDTDPQIGVRLQVARDSGFASPVVDATWETTVNHHRFPTTLTSGIWAWRIATRDEVGWGPWSAARLFVVDTFPLWRSLRITSGRQIPSGETRSVALELVTETGFPVPWPSSASITIGDRSFWGLDFVSESSIGRIGLRFDTPGAVAVTVREDVQVGRDTLTVIARPSAPASTDTYCFLYGRHGSGQRVIEDDTRLTIVLRTLVSDTRYRLRVSTTMDTLLLADAVPTSVDSGLVFWSNMPVTLSGGDRIIARIFRDSVLVAYERALVLALPTRAIRFRESETGTSIVIDMPAGACDTPLFISVSRTVGDSVHRSASDNARRNGRSLVEGSVVDITATDIDGRVIAKFSGNLTLRIPAAAANGLRIAFMKDGAWEEITGTTWDSATQEARAATDHLTVWGLTVATLAGANVNNVRIYPNPWRSDGPTGSMASSNAAYGVKFDQMPAGQVRIRVFTIAGELVLDGTLDPSSLGATSANGHLQVVDVGGLTGQVTRWDLKNQHGNDVASGLYLIVLEGPGGRATRRFAVIR